MAESEDQKGKYVTVNLSHISTILLVALLCLTVFQSFQIASLSNSLDSFNTTALATLATASADTASASNTANTASSAGSAGTQQVDLQQIAAEVIPTGTPDYGAAANVSYDAVEAGLTTLVGYDKEISLQGADQERYIGIATTPGTACEYCCPITANDGFGTSSGRLACGCAHNIAFSGLTKWLIQNTDYSDAQILEEIQNWKALFFPRDTVKAELANRNISPEAVGLPERVGGC